MSRSWPATLIPTTQELRWHANSVCAITGIPKFYRWLSERYPLVNQPIAETSVPVVDNLYLDMNGIIHNCTHGNDPGRKITEQEMIVKVFGYLEKLFQIVQPQKLLFMAIDGMSPSVMLMSRQCAIEQSRHTASDFCQEGIPITSFILMQESRPVRK